MKKLASKFKTCCISQEASDALDYLSDATKFSKRQILDDVFLEILGVIASLENCANSTRIGWFVESSISAQTITITLIGKNRIAMGSYEKPSSTSDSDCNEETKSRIENEFNKRMRGKNE